MRSLLLSLLAAPILALPLLTGCSATVEPDGYGYANYGYYYDYPGPDVYYYDRYPHYYHHGAVIYRHDFDHDRDDHHFDHDDHGNHAFYGRRGPAIEHHEIAHGRAPAVHGREGGGHMERGVASERP